MPPRTPQPPPNRPPNAAVKRRNGNGQRDYTRLVPQPHKVRRIRRQHRPLVRVLQRQKIQRHHRVLPRRHRVQPRVQFVQHRKQRLHRNGFSVVNVVGKTRVQRLPHNRFRRKVKLIGLLLNAQIASRRPKHNLVVVVRRRHFERQLFRPLRPPVKQLGRNGKPPRQFVLRAARPQKLPNRVLRPLQQPVPKKRNARTHVFPPPPLPPPPLLLHCRPIPVPNSIPIPNPPKRTKSDGNPALAV